MMWVFRFKQATYIIRQKLLQSARRKSKILMKTYGIGSLKY